MPRTPMSPRRKPPGNAHNSETAQSIPPPLVGGGEGVFEPGTWVTDLSGHMGDTLCMGGEVAHAVGREQRDGREGGLYCVLAEWGGHGGGAVATVPDQPQDSIQDDRPVRDAGLGRPAGLEPSAASSPERGECSDDRSGADGSP